MGQLALQCNWKRGNTVIVYNEQNLPAEKEASATANKSAKTAELQAAFNAAINSNVFMSFDEKIKSLLDALSIPISDDQSYNQFFIHSTKDLQAEAGIAAAKAGQVPVMPTTDQIHAEARKRYDEKVAKDKRQTERRAAKAGNSAPVELQQAA